MPGKNWCLSPGFKEHMLLYAAGQIQPLQKIVRHGSRLLPIELGRHVHPSCHVRVGSLRQIGALSNERHMLLR